MKKILNISSLFALMGLFSCSVSRHIPAGESLYKGAEIKVVADNSFTKKEITAVKEELATIVRPLPNSNLMGFPYKVWFYYFIGQPKKEGDLRSWFKKRLSEEPIFAKKGIVTTNADLISNYLDNEGYFGSIAKGVFEEKNKEATAVYTAHLKPRYFIENVSFNSKDTTFFGRNLAATQANTLLKSKNPYSFQDIKAERDRIANALRKKGFYLFYPDYLVVLADTTLGNHKVNLTISVKPTTSQINKKVYYIKDIFVNLNDAKTDSSSKVSQKIISPNFHLINSTNYRSRIFLDAIGFRSGSLFSSDLQDISLSRLTNLQNFKFVKNRFDLVSRSDSALLNLNYYLTTIKKRSISAEIKGESKSNGLIGSVFSLTWRNRNTFRGGEQLSLSANVSYDWQIGGGASNQFNNYVQWSLQENLSVPRFLVPFIKIDPERNVALPKTDFAVSYGKRIKKDLYDQTLLAASMTYAWRKGTTMEHSYSPFSINVVSTNATPDFVTQIFLSDNPAKLLQILDERLTLGANYNFNYTPKKQTSSQNVLTFNGGADIAGNLAGLVAQKANEGDPRQLFGILYEQYARFNADLRYYRQVSTNVRWANRLMMGVGIPYGNSTTLPQFKQFFSGGTNSIRAFGARRLGPGSYYLSQNYLDAYGDIKLEMNTELRAKFTNYIHGAAFVDAGNIWMAKDASYYDDRAVFSNNFMKELAVGTGLGLRFDFTYVLFRFDVAFPIRKPWLEENNRWVLNQIDFSSHVWRDDNLILNIAVGYPF